jgi:hypothetical protein
MALVATVTKKTVTYVLERVWNITLNMVLKDAGVTVFDKDYSVEYIPGDLVAAKEDTLTAMMQADIDKYKSEQVIFGAAALVQAVTNVQGGLVV